jgi:hypothetical protein
MLLLGLNFAGKLDLVRAESLEPLPNPPPLRGARNVRPSIVDGGGSDDRRGERDEDAKD